MARTVRLGLLCVVFVASGTRLTACRVDGTTPATTQGILVYEDQLPPAQGAYSAVSDPLRHIVKSGDAWLYGRFIVQSKELYPQPRLLAGDRSLTEADFLAVIANELALARRLEGLITAAGQPTEDRGIIFGMPQIPWVTAVGPGTAWPTVPAATNGTESRKNIVKWFLDRVKATEANLPNPKVNVAGTYWIPEELTIKPLSGGVPGRLYDDDLMRFWATTSSAQYLSTWWSPYHGAPGSLDAHTRYSVDYVSVQSSYSFHNFLDGGYINSSRARRDGQLMISRGQTTQIELRGTTHTEAGGAAEDRISERLLHLASAQHWVRPDRATITFSAKAVWSMAEANPALYDRLVALLAGEQVPNPDPEPIWSLSPVTGASACVAETTLVPAVPVGSLLVSGLPLPAAGLTSNVRLFLQASRTEGGTQTAWTVAPSGDDAWSIPLDTSPTPLQAVPTVDHLRLLIIGAACPAAVGPDGLPNLRIESDNRVQFSQAEGPGRVTMKTASSPGSGPDLMTQSFDSSSWSKLATVAEASRLTDGLISPAYESAASWVTARNPGHGNAVFDLGSGTPPTVAAVRIHVTACSTSQGLVFPQRLSVAIGSRPTFDIAGAGPPPAAGATLNYEDAGWYEELTTGSLPMNGGCARWIELPLPAQASGRYVSLVVHGHYLTAIDEIQLVGDGIPEGLIPWITPPLDTSPKEALGGGEVYLENGKLLTDGIGALGFAEATWVGARSLGSAWTATKELAAAVPAESVEIWVSNHSGYLPSGSSVTLIDSAGSTQTLPLPASPTFLGQQPGSVGYQVTVPSELGPLHKIAVEVPNTNHWVLLSEIVARPR